MTGRAPRIPPQGARAPGPTIAAHVKTIGVRRTAWGTSGRAVQVVTNHFEAKIPEGIIHHYDGEPIVSILSDLSLMWLINSTALSIVILPDDKNLPAKLNLDIIKALQESNPTTFTPKAVYDGRKNLFAIRALPLKNGDKEEFRVMLKSEGAPQAPPSKKKEPKEYRVRLSKVAQINPEVLLGFLQGRQSHDNAVLTAITALNVVIRMLPISQYPFNVRSFFTDKEKKDIGGGLILWRGYFQSIRPGGNRMWINIDISTGTMYKDGPLISLCLSHLGRSQPQELTQKGGFTERDRIKLQRFIAGIRIYTTHTQSQGQPARVIKKITPQGAAQLQFTTRDGGKPMLVAAYFRDVLRLNLEFPFLPCVEVGNGALIPLELCMVPAGQIMRKQVPPEKTRDVLQFSTQKPQDRLNSIKNGIDVFEYNRSEYLKSFGMQVKTQTPVMVPARVLQPPTLVYGKESKQRNIKPENGAWNMKDKKFFRPGPVKGWVMVVFERPQRFDKQTIDGCTRAMITAAAHVGIRMDPEPVIHFVMVSYANTQAPIRPQLVSAGNAWKAKHKDFPNLIVAVLPENAADVYTAIKHFGDCMTGVATQCMKSLKCGRGTSQYFANVCLKLNVKLGGVNCIPLAQDVPVLTDPSNPTIVFGADVIHPSPGSDGRPSFTALVGNVDSENSKFVAKCCMQESRVEMIQDLRTMARDILHMFQTYHTKVEMSKSPPKKVIFFRQDDGVSEGQFKTVLEEEVPRIKAAFGDVGLKDQLVPKLTVIVVGKRHHVRFFPTSKADSDNSGNCRAGTVVDREISHPTEFDFYLQSHAGLLGTSRPSHYNVLLDENNFTPDALQQLSFALCHVYARSTRSVSIPAPVYYADIVCSRAKNHFDPAGSIDFDANNTSERGTGIEAFKKHFKPLHPTAASTMYFS
ncbi:argonaute-like protein [Hysterangium stoloniferum]|nr:argonaute-like protein [Hysterangium stoloniferum]